MLGDISWMDFGLLGMLGATAGLLMGLLGIAGGTVLVPALLGVLTTLYRVPADQAIRIATATSLACIFVATLAKLAAQSRLGTLRAGVVAPMLPTIAAGAALAALASQYLPSRLLQTAFGVYLIAYLAYSLLRKADGAEDARVALPAGEARAVGLGIGFASGLLGIGGAFLSTPYLVWRGMNTKGANAAAPAVLLAVSVVGTAAYLLVPVPAQAPGLVGSVALPMLLLMGVPAALLSAVAERWGARLPSRVHKRAFECLLLVVAVRILLNP
jgi:uncharacterized membrane protein YfcA